eukprot:173207-Amphidinium_carterae.2
MCAPKAKSQGLGSTLSGYIYDFLKFCHRNLRKPVTRSSNNQQVAVPCAEEDCGTRNIVKGRAWTTQRSSVHNVTTESADVTRVQGRAFKFATCGTDVWKVRITI